METPLLFFRVPRLKLVIPSIQRPSAMVVFGVVFMSYFLVLSGLIYDVIVEPPSIGVTRDEVTGMQKPVAFLQHRINGQYIIEGLSAGFLFALGGLGYIFLDRSVDAYTPRRNRYLFALGGVLLVLIAYNLCVLFLRIKIPGYLRE